MYVERTITNNTNSHKIANNNINPMFKKDILNPRYFLSILS